MVEVSRRYEVMSNKFRQFYMRRGDSLEVVTRKRPKPGAVVVLAGADGPEVKTYTRADKDRLLGVALLSWSGD